MTALLRALALVAAALPWRAVAALGAALGFVAGSVLRVRRRHVEHAMREASLDAPAATARRMYAALGTSAFELLSMVARPARALDRVRLEAVSVRPWRAALERGRGVVLAASHTGNWDLAACAVAREVELLVVTKRLRVAWLDRFWQSARAARGVRLVEAAGALAESRRVLARGGAVAMMIDQAPGARPHGHVIEAEFLGRPALVDRAPAALAACAGAPLVVAASRRGPDGHHALVVLDVLVPPRRARRAWVADATLAATRRLDAFVRAHPEQWLWLHRRWKRLDHDSRRAMLAPPCPTRPMPLPPPGRPPTRSSSPAAPSGAG